MTSAVWKAALGMNSMGIIVGLELIMTAMKLVGPVPPVANFTWLLPLLKDDGVAAMTVIFGSSVFCMGIAGMMARASNEPPTRATSLMFGLLHLCLAVTCALFRHLAGFFPGLFGFHAILGCMFLSCFPLPGQASSAPTVPQKQKKQKKKD